MLAALTTTSGADTTVSGNVTTGTAAINTLNNGNITVTGTLSGTGAVTLNANGSGNITETASGQQHLQWHDADDGFRFRHDCYL